MEQTVDKAVDRLSELLDLATKTVDRASKTAKDLEVKDRLTDAVSALRRTRVTQDDDSGIERFMTGMLIGSVNRYGIGDLKAALTHLAGLPEVDPDRVGAIGFCMGGGFAIAWACTDTRLKAIAPFYAANPRPLDAVQRACPIVGSYPEKDFTASAGRALDTELERHKIAHDIKIYPGAGHSFFNDRGRAYNKEVAADSWSRVLAFFGEHLADDSL